MSLAPVAGERVRLEADLKGLAVIRMSDEQLVGKIRLDESGDSLVVRAVWIHENMRGYGCGSEAAFLLLQQATAAGYRLVRAWAPPNLGLAVYFWFRMGFHPLHGEGPEGGIWFERRLGQAAPALVRASREQEGAQGSEPHVDAGPNWIRHSPLVVEGQGM